MKIVLLPNKEGLELRLLVRLKQEERKTLQNSRRDYLPYAQIYKKICGCFCLKKEELRDKLQELEKFGFIERKGFIGIKLNYEVSDND